MIWLWAGPAILTLFCAATIAGMNAVKNAGKEYYDSWGARQTNSALELAFSYGFVALLSAVLWPVSIPIYVGTKIYPILKQRIEIRQIKAEEEAKLLQEAGIP